MNYILIAKKRSSDIFMSETGAETLSPNIHPLWKTSDHEQEAL